MIVTDSDAAKRPRHSRRFWIGLLLLPVALAILVSLGTWQVKRLHWKEDLLASIEQRSHAEPLDYNGIMAALEAGEPIDYRAARASGEFLHDKERHFFATFEGQSGFYLYTPLQLDDGRFLFINRGFVPYDRKAASTRPQSLVAGAQHVTGLARARLAEKPSSMVPENAEMTLPFFLDADSTPVPGGLPRGGVTMIDLPNSHLQYAITWYGLALALAGVGIFGWMTRKS